jgi:UMF1 family MFS transporter
VQQASQAERFGWAMYDFANSSYTTVIVTVYYAVVFPKLIVGDGPDYRYGNLLWSVTLSLSYGLPVLLLPVLGAMMDRAGRKKMFLLGSTLVTVLATAALALAGPGEVALAMALLVVSNIGFSVGESFIASFLPDLGPPELLGRISGMAWGLGYLGGLGSTALVLFGLGPTEPGNPLVWWAGPITAAWFALASLPTFLLLRDRSQPRPLPPGQTVLSAGFAQVVGTFGQMRRYRDLLVFLVGHLFAMAGLSIVVAFAFIYGDQVVGWSQKTAQAMFVLTQLTATVGALLFGWLQGKVGDKPTYLGTLALWCLAVALIRFTPSLASLVGMDAETVFLGVGCVAGLCIGSTQSAARTLVALLSPPDRVGEFFGLWGMFGKLAAVIGLLSLGGLQATVGLENGILVTGGFFAAGLVVVAFVDVARGRAVAAAQPVR